MRIIFIENRYTTRFWQSIATQLIREGHDVAFIVQNHLFRPFGYKNFIIPYPPKDERLELSEIDSELIKSDRQVRYFRLKSNSHYPYYHQKIGEILDNFVPDAVFGESTAFHELITIEECKIRNIIFLQPATCRYPVGRFSFYLNETLEPYLGSEQKMSKEECLKIIDGIINRTIKPDYMIQPDFKFKEYFYRIRELVLLTVSNFMGEHYTTPNPIIKLVMERKRKAIIKRWDKYAEININCIENENFKILYPMQVQPESNIDVWGRQHNDQFSIIRNIIDNTSKDILLVIKPNPKSKYELNDKLMNYIENEPRIIIIPHNISMKYVFTRVNMVLTVSGTIAMECILSNKPVFTMIRTLNNRYSNCIFLDNLTKLMYWINVIRNKQFPEISEQEKIDYINLLNATSFKGYPYFSSSQKNVNYCLSAFNFILASISHAKNLSK